MTLTDTLIELMEMAGPTGQEEPVHAWGRVALPKETRSELGLETGNILIVDTDGDRRIIYMAKPDNPLDVLAIAALEEDHAGPTVDLDDVLDLLNGI